MNHRPRGGGIRWLVLLVGMACGGGEPPWRPDEVRIPKAWTACFADKYEPTHDGVPVVLRVTQTMPSFRLRALCITVESGVVATGDSRDEGRKSLERQLALAPGDHVFVLRALFVAPGFRGYTFDVRSSHTLALPADTSWTLTANFSEADDGPINYRPKLSWKEERSSLTPSDGGTVDRDGAVGPESQ